MRSQTEGPAHSRAAVVELIPAPRSLTSASYAVHVGAARVENVAKLRLNVLFAGGTEGAHRACVVLGIIATCRAIGVPVQAYLTWAFERLGTHRDIYDLPIDQLAPAAFKRARA